MRNFGVEVVLGRVVRFKEKRKQVIIEQVYKRLFHKVFAEGKTSEEPGDERMY